MSNSVSISLEQNPNVIIGQQLIFTVTLNSDRQISEDTTITIANSIGVSLISSSLIDITAGLFTLTVYISSSLNSGDNISFDLVISNDTDFHYPTINCTAKTLDPNSLTIYFDKNYLDVPIGPNSPPGENDGKSQTKVMARIKDNQGIFLPKVSVFIYTGNSSDIEKLDFYKYDNSTKIELYKSDNMKGIFLNSDESGRIIFYVYAQEKNLLTTNFYSSIFGVAEGIDANKSLNVVPTRPDDPHDLLDPPSIEGFKDEGQLTTHGAQSFLVKIPQYKNSEPGDDISFFINNQPTIYDYPLQDTSKLGNYFISLPYEMFENETGVSCQFTYRVTSQSSWVLFSRPLTLTYTGKPWPEPTYYDKCVVYSSFGTDNSSNIIDDFGNTDCVDIKDNNVVTCKTISNYKNNNGNGLTVEITGTNDITDITKPPLGANIRLVITVNAKHRNFTKNIDTHMPTKPGPDGTTAVATIGIPYDLLTGCSMYKNCHTGLLQFDYYVLDNITSPHATSWKGRITTALTGSLIDCSEVYNDN
ncbi:hypothetical protein [Xenorhabdus koppenhoeferi]|uniref:Uncharacterized protein n=1 Tax=Xenorhabdus koppenhoeferi TaxID=351659 RepID=A0A1I7HGL0_9GAMM|nr:hypothetical protein [Xenorhabdus koppenhoeferi]SFU59679.1 hypothetical protein SAMN05421784_11419 [Xenorhabdus koppenhoeferi]